MQIIAKKRKENLSTHIKEWTSKSVRCGNGEKGVFLIYFHFVFFFASVYFNNHNCAYKNVSVRTKTTATKMEGSKDRKKEKRKYGNTRDRSRTNTRAFNFFNLIRCYTLRMQEKRQSEWERNGQCSMKIYPLSVCVRCIECIIWHAG